MRHLLRHCKEFPAEEKKKLREKLAAEKARTSPSKSTRAQIAQQGEAQKQQQPPAKTAGRLANTHGTAACDITLKDDNATLPCIGRCDDGADESIASPRLAEAAVLSGIGKLKKINPVTVQVALKDQSDAQKFKFSREWAVPRLVLHLSVGPPALLNVTFLVVDAELAENDILIGQPVLKHLGIDSKTMLENNRAELNETDSSGVVRDDMVPSTVGRILIARIRGVQNMITNFNYGGGQNMKTPAVYSPPRPRSNYYVNKADVDPFPNLSLIDLPDEDQAASVRTAVEDMLKDALVQGFPHNRFDDLRKTVMARLGVFRTDFSQSSAPIPPLRLELKPDAKPVHVKIRKYSDSQRRFLRKLVDKLLDAGLVYPNPASKWSCAPHLVPKPGPAKWRFTVDLRPVNRYTYALHFPMPLIEAELAKAAGAKIFCEFDMTHG